ncbi:MAG: hypothetical protein WAV15_04600 [Minisyncoccia bacterium]
MTSLEYTPLDPRRRETSLADAIDNRRSGEQSREIARVAEEMVIDYLNKFFGARIKVRRATALEDAGDLKTEMGKQVDAVAYDDKGPAMCLQITTARSPAVINEKMKQLAERPVVRLPEMRSRDAAIPKVLVRLDPKDVEYFMKDRDFTRHVDMQAKILHEIKKGLKDVFSMTKDKDQKKRIVEVLTIFEPFKTQFCFLYFCGALFFLLWGY